MSRPQETKTYTISGSQDVMRRFERFLALLHFNSAWGHSATFCMPLDGDGWDKFQVHDFHPDFYREVGLIGGVGYPLEIALDDGYTCKPVGVSNRFYAVKDGKLMRDGEVIKVAK